MPYSVLIVDDSHFFQTRLKEIINECPELKVVGLAANGQEAIVMTAKLKPDIISMDYEMPLMDGVSAVRRIMDDNPTPIIMFSSMTYEGARITLDALDAGAVDFMNKNFAEVSANSAIFKKKFHEKLIYFARNANTTAAKAAQPFGSRASLSTPSPVTAPGISASSLHSSSSLQKSASALASSASARASLNPDSSSAASVPSRRTAVFKLAGKVKILVIGASTGGPVAVAEIISQLPANFPVPVLVVQHMPENFTKAFAERLNRQSALTVKEAENGDRIVKGSVLVAPGGKQMMVDRNGGSIKIIDGDDRVNYKPCVDITFASVAGGFGDAVLGVVLTGMGSDGCDGARILVGKGSIIWSQDKASSVVYGMPAAVAKENLSTCILPLKEIASKIISSFSLSA